MALAPTGAKVSTYEVDLASYELHGSAPVPELCNGVPHYIDLTFINDDRQAAREVSTRIVLTLNGPKTGCLEANDIQMTLVAEEACAWASFLNSHFTLFVDLVATRIVLGSEAEDALWIEAASSEAVWVLSSVRKGIQVFETRLLRVRPAAPKIDYLLQSGREREESIKLLYTEFKNWLSPFFPFCDPTILSPGILAIKVSSETLWFLRFPISLFCHSGFEGFVAYKGVEWIVSAKGFLQNARERADIRTEFLDLVTLIEHTVVVINTYRIHDCWLWRIGTRLVIEVLECLNAFSFQDQSRVLRTVSLRWYCNPRAKQIEDLLLDPKTRYFFADFEADGGQWLVGDGGYCSWQLDPGIDWLTTPGPNKEGEAVSWRDLRGRLQHVRLMRVFHCYSIFNAYAAAQSDCQPGDTESIGGTLINLGAQRVEGGMNQESYFDHLCSLLYLFCEAEHFRFALRLKCIERGIDFDDLLGRTNDFLIACNRDPIRTHG